MKTLLLVAGSRAGSEFFQSLFDGHPEVLQFPGNSITSKKQIESISSDNPNQIVLNFIKNRPHFFDSRVGMGKIERYDKLGENKDQYYFVDKEKFRMNFLRMFSEEFHVNNSNKLHKKILLLHKAYAKTCNQDINKKKIMIINTHEIAFTRYLTKELSNVDFDIIHTIRNPLSSISSSVNNWIHYDEGKHFFAKSIFFQLDLIVNGIKQLSQLNKKLFLIQLEMLHKSHFAVMNDFCNTYNLTYENCLKYSTFFDLKWWGDKVSGKDLNGISKDFKIQFNEKTFYNRDINFLEYIMKDYIIFYGYKFTKKTSRIIPNLMPMKCELITWKNTIKHKKIKHILSIPFFYFKRLFYINRYSQKNLKMPHSFGLKSKN